MLVVLSQSVSLRAQRRGVDIGTAAFSAAPYQVGELITYNVSFANFVTAAHVELFVAGRGLYSGNDGIELRAHVETVGVVSSALYAINNDYTTIVNPTTGVPFRAQLVTHDGGQSGAQTLQEAAGGSSNLFGGFDFLSALYRLRAVPLTEGASYHVLVSDRTDQYDCEIRVVGRESIKTALGSYNALVTEARVLNNQSLNNTRARLYFSDGPQHLPLLISIKLPAGEIRAEIASLSISEPAAPATPVNPPATVRPPAVNNSGAASLPLGSDLPFAVGEQLNYQVYMGNTPQPFASLSYLVRPRAKYFGRDGVLLSGTAQTAGAAQRLITVNDQINSYVDPNTLLPFRTEIKLQEGKRRVNSTLTIEQDRGTAQNERGQRIEMPVGTHDLISVLYAIRSFSLAPNKRNAVSILINNRPQTLFVDAVRRETIKLGTQSIEAIQLNLATDEPQGDKYAIRVWVGADRRRLPLRITATSPLGPLRADLAVLPVTTQ